MFLSVIIRQQGKTEMALKESERRFRALVDSAPVLVWMSGVDALCTFFSKPWLDFTGKPLEQQLGNGWAECVHEDDREGCEQQYLAAFNERKDFTLEYRLLHKSGVHRWVLDKGIPRYAPDGSFLGYVGGCVDITDRKEAEEALRQMGVELIHAQETERQRIGQELHDDLAQRLSALSMRLSSIAKNYSAKRSFLRDVEILRKQSIDLCKDVSSLSHQLRPPTLLKLGLHSALRNLSEQSSHGSLIVTCAVDEPLPRISEEVAISLYRVAQEAVRNAQRHSGADRIQIAVKIEDSGLSISIRDNGCGFVPGASIRRGLGLSSMTDRVRRLGGNLSITSNPGSGTVVAALVPWDIATKAASQSA